MRPKSRVVVINLTLIAAGLLGTELVAGSWFDEPSLGALDVPAFREQFIDTSGLYPGGGIVDWRRDRHGLRGSHSTPDKVNILAIGGSTTAENMINDGQTWTDVLARELSTPARPVFVANAGMDGQSTFGHLKAFDEWFARIPGLTPRYVLFYVGINDLTRSSLIPVFDGFVPGSRLQRLHNQISNNSVLLHMLRKARGLYRAYISGVVHQPANEEFADLGERTLVPLPLEAQAVPARRPIDDEVARRYPERLRRLADATRAMGATPVFVNQMWHGVFRQGKALFVRRRHADKAQSLHESFVHYTALARLTMETCRRMNRSICIDLAERLELAPQDLYDYVHTTPAGSAKVGRFLATALRPHMTARRGN